MASLIAISIDSIVMMRIFRNMDKDVKMMFQSMVAATNSYDLFNINKWRDDG